MFHLSRLSRTRLEGVDPVLIFIIEQALIYSPVDFAIPRLGGVRTERQQYDLFKKGLSKCDGYKIKSKHQVNLNSYEQLYGLAFDVVPLVNGAISYDPVHVAIVGSAIMTTAQMLLSDGQVPRKLRWGLTFGSDEHKGWDGCHFEEAS